MPSISNKPNDSSSKLTNLIGYSFHADSNPVSKRSYRKGIESGTGVQLVNVDARTGR